MSARPVELVRREDDAIVGATLYSGMAPADLLLVERVWSEERNALLMKCLEHGIDRSRRPQSLHWDWSRKAQLLNLLEATAFGLEVDGSWQGVMLTRTAIHTARVPADAGKPLVYVDFLESAPWNWRVPDLGVAGRYKGIGAVLFRTAVEQSVDEGFHGRVGLHSLPQSDGFYRDQFRMTPLGRDPDKQNLMYFELTRQAAQQLLEGGA